jgi:hypothetical protein
MIRIVCSTRRHPFSAIIRFINGSLWSHEAILDGDNVIEALGSTGVHSVPFEQAKKHYIDYAILEFDVPDAEAGMAFARAQIGKQYDWGAIFWQWLGRVFLMLGLERNWQDDSKWICFELREAVLLAAGRPTIVRGGSCVIRWSDCWQSPFGRLVVPPKSMSVN